MPSDQLCRVFLDSGAPTLYNRLVRQDKGASHMGSHLKDRKHDDFSFITGETYLEYRDKYIAYIKKHEHLLETYVNLDIINNPQATWDNQKYLEDHGLKPIPVFHFGANLKWLRMYVNKGYEYIAIGGMVPNPPSVLIPALDNIWGNVLTDGKGMPQVKIHGFAMTSVRLMCRYPWYSVDSASWVKYAMYGAVLVPKLLGNEFDFTQNPNRIFLSTRSARTSTAGGGGLDEMPATQRARYVAYMRDHGYELGSSTFRLEKTGYKAEQDERVYKNPNSVPHFKGKAPEGMVAVEEIIERGLANDYQLREELNAEFYMEVQNRTPAWPWAFKHKRRGLF